MSLPAAQPISHPRDGKADLLRFDECWSGLLLL